MYLMTTSSYTFVLHRVLFYLAHENVATDRLMNLCQFNLFSEPLGKIVPGDWLCVRMMARPFA